MSGLGDVVVRPVRFTDGVAAMRAFLETVGLSARIESTGGRWVDMVAGSGMVALHSAADSEGGVPAGETRLSFECRDAEQLAQTLRRNGFPDAHWVDETYSRTVFVTDPDGVELAADQVQDDLYGYRAAGPGMPDADTLAVLPVRFTADQAAMARLLILRIAPPRRRLDGRVAGARGRRPGRPARHQRRREWTSLRVTDPDRQQVVVHHPPQAP